MIFKGSYSGFIAQMAAFVGSFLGIAVASQTYILVAQKIQIYFESFSTACVVGYLLVIFVIFAFCVIVGKYIKKMFMIKMATWLDHILGGVLGFMLATIITLFGIQMGLKVQDLQSPIENSILIPYVNNAPNPIKRLLPLGNDSV